jgi:hypothetical protein
MCALLTQLDKKIRPPELIRSDLRDIVVAHTGLEPVVSALRGQRVSRLHQCAVSVWNYRCGAAMVASCEPVLFASQ